MLIYELLDELMDFGYPQSTETKILQEYDLIHYSFNFYFCTSVGGYSSFCRVKLVQSCYELWTMLSCVSLHYGPITV